MRHDGFCVNNEVFLYERLFFYVLLVCNIANENVILKIITWFDVDRYVGCLHAVLLITGPRLQRLYLQPPSDINTMSVVHAVRGPGTRKFTDST